MIYLISVALYPRGGIIISGLKHRRDTLPTSLLLLLLLVVVLLLLKNWLES